MKVHRVVLYVVDHDEIGEAQVTEVLESTRYPNRCISPKVDLVDTIAIKWNERGPLNKSDRAISLPAFRALFRRDVDAIVRAVLETHDGPELWDHSRRDPEAFRNAVRAALEKP